MFDVLLESGRRPPTRRGATTLLSAVIQSLLVAALVVAPMIYTDSIPGFTLKAEPVAFTPPPRGVTAPETSAGGGGGSSQVRPILTEAPDDVIREPGQIPDRITAINDSPGMPGLPPGPPRCPACIPDGIGPPSNALPIVATPAQPARPTRVSLPESVLERGYLVRKVVPRYPDLPRRIGVQGEVVLRALIARDGSMQSVRVVRGHPTTGSGSGGSGRAVAVPALRPERPAHGGGDDHHGELRAEALTKRKPQRARRTQRSTANQARSAGIQ